MGLEREDLGRGLKRECRNCAEASGTPFWIDRQGTLDRAPGATCVTLPARGRSRSSVGESLSSAALSPNPLQMQDFSLLPRFGPLKNAKPVSPWSSFGV